MPDILENITEAEIKEETEGTRRLARHEAESNRALPQYYDLEGNYVYWLGWLTRDSRGNVERSFANLCLVLELDPKLSHIGYNQFTDSFEATGPLPWREKPGPWRDSDDAQLMRYVDQRVASFPMSYYPQALAAQADRQGFHPVRQYFWNLPIWDEVPRVDTLLIDYLGAQDSPYVRAVTRKTLCAAVRRIYEPGCKFDNILVLSGPQGIGKSTLLSRLGMGWFSDSLTVSDMNDKTAAEQLQGHWLIEIGEMAGMKKAELEKVKAFLTRQDDKFRAAYGRRVSSHPRQCVFFGTTNEEGYLRDLTGNRRFWTVPVTGQGSRKPWELDQATLDQIWVEALLLAGRESLYLDPELEGRAREAQREALERDDREGLVRAYLETPIPRDWDRRDYGERVRWYLTPTLARSGETDLIPRERTSNLEIWCECFGEAKQRMSKKDSSAINAIMTRIEGWEKQASTARRGPYGPQRVYARSRQPSISGEQLPLQDLELQS